MMQRRFQRGFLTLLFALCLSPLLFAQEKSWVQETLISVPIDRSVRNSFGVYTDGADVVIHLHNSGGLPPRLIDAASGLDWTGGLSRFEKMRRVYDYASDLEPRGSYLIKLGCDRWRVCTGLEGVDFVLMAREGAAANQLQFRLLRFSALFSTVEKVFSGLVHDNPGTLSREALIALEEVSKNGLRSRYRDAFRLITSLEQANRLGNSSWLRQLSTTPILLSVDDSGFNLAREVDLAICRAHVFSIKPGLKQGSPTAIEALKVVLGSCSDFYIHMIDWLLDIPIDERNQLAQRLIRAGHAAKNEDLSQMGLFLSVNPRKAASDQVNSASYPPARINDKRPTGSTKSEAGGKRSTQVDAQESGQGATASPREPLRNAMQDITDELIRIKGVKNKALLLSYSEKRGVANRDGSSLSGTVFKVAVPDRLSDGTFVIVATQGERSEVPMVVGNYRIKVRLRLESVRIEECTRPLACLFKEKERRISDVRTEAVDFFLRQANLFRNEQTVKFGPLLPPDLGLQSATQVHLSEVRLVLELLTVESN